MRRKPVPDPQPLEGLWTIRDALPLVPGSVEDCCRRLTDRTDVPDRESARSWLTFLVALGAADTQGDGFYRPTDRPDRDTLATHFRENVLGVEEVLSVLADNGPLTAEDVFAETRDIVPKWERQRDPSWEQTWCDRTDRLLAWAVTFDIVRKTDDGYRLTR